MSTATPTYEIYQEASPVQFINTDGSANIDECQCTAPKMAVFFSCKACAVRQDRYSTEIEPGQDPCPLCQDGKNPAFTYCTSCAIERRYINVDRSANPECPNDQCSCGATKAAVFAFCNPCRYQHMRGITIHANPDALLLPP